MALPPWVSARDVSGERLCGGVRGDVQRPSGDEHGEGHLEFLAGPSKAAAPREIGALIVFPSFVMHRVTRVTHGVRCCLLGWTMGPRFC